MNNILFESFDRINNIKFNGEYVLILPRFSSFFDKYNHQNNEEELKNIITSYRQCLEIFYKVVCYEKVYSSENHYIHSSLSHMRTIVFDKDVFSRYAEIVMSIFAIIKQTQLKGMKEYSEENFLNMLHDLKEQNKVKDYIKNSFETSLIFLRAWEEELNKNRHTNLEEEFLNKLNNNKSLFVTETPIKILLPLLIAQYRCGDLSWPVHSLSDNIIDVLADLANMKKEKLVEDLSQEIFFKSIFQHNNNYCGCIDDVLNYFNKDVIQSLLTDSPKEYLLSTLLEKVPEAQLSASSFSHVEKDLIAIKEAMQSQEKFKVLLHGVAGTGKTEFSKVISKVTHKPMYRLKIKETITYKEKKIESLSEKLISLLTICSVFKENDFILLLDECEELFENKNQYKEHINYMLDEINIDCIFIANDIKNFHHSYLRRFNYHVNMEVCNYNQKLLIVKKALDEVACDENIMKYIATHSVTNAELSDNIHFFKTTNNINYLRQKIENSQITKDMLKLDVIEKSLYDLIMPENNDYQFEQIIGYEEEREILLSLEHYLKNKTKYEEVGAKIPHGSILYGFPGTGKTSIIKALAKKCQLPLISVSTGMMSNDAQGALNIKKIFNVAKKNMPCIILLDEFEKMALNRKLEMSNGTSQSLMNQLLMEMDELHQANHDVFVYATCNTINYIDPAISRSGRLEQMIEIGLPSMKVRNQIFKKLLGENNQLKGLKQIVQHTTGFSFVDIQSIINNYKINLLKNTKKQSRQSLLTKEVHDFILGKKTTTPLQKEEKELVAYHESGHAFLAYLFDKAVGNVSIIPKSGYLGVTLMLQDESKHIRSKQDLEREVMILLAGKASEIIFLKKETTGSGDDFKRATHLVMNNLNVLAEKELGLMYTDMSSYDEQFSETYKVKVEKSVNKILQDLYKKTQTILTESQEEIQSMVNRLLKNEEMVQHEMEGLLNEAMTAKKVTKMHKIS